ncbi:MFS transporter [Microbacterium sp. KUDC0406]|uniref:MFS transporter n=1 Tax=Microbacterium sp. KUDC0406 TaxID=2909588 RepID=UPI001F367ED0|nr:MFS transporter [Microbacterium sp. KUDC0406]UJP09234.1 MFS transporter [Microbacterium sp. KUDC0406]
MTGSLSPSKGRPLWHGRTLAVLGIVLLAFSLRSAVASLSPVVDLIAADFPVPPVVLGLIGAAPPVCYAVFGLATPWLEQRLGLERLTVLASALITAGLVARGFAVDSVTLIAATALVFAGVGAGNILLPPLVKKYFPDRLGLMMTVYSVAMATSTFLPPLVAVPVADAAGWRISLAEWAVFAVASMIPWIVLMLRDKSRVVERAKRDETLQDPGEDVSSPVASLPSRGDQEFESVTGPVAVAPADSRILHRLPRLPLAWAMTFVFGVSASMAYVSFGWLPQVIADVGGVSAAEAGFLLGVFSVMALPCSLVVPGLTVKFAWATPMLLLTSVVTGSIGLLGLVLAPQAFLYGWVVLYGLTGIMFPMSLALLSIRARTHESAVALSGFVQSLGYAFAAVFPILFGVLHGATGGWQVPLLMMVALLVAAVPAGVMIARPMTVEDAWTRRHGKW